MDFGEHVTKDKFKSIPAALAAYQEQQPNAKTAQIFVMGPMNSKINIDDQEVAEIRKLNPHLKIFVHSAYVVHPWGEAAKTRAAAIILLKKELEVCDAIGAAGLVVHINEDATPDDYVHQLSKLNLHDHHTPIYLENIWNKHYVASYSNPDKLIPLFEFIHKSIPASKVRYCLDTSHLWAQGYDVASKVLLHKYLHQIKNLHPLIHLNDNKYPKGGLKDEHDPIGKGKIWGHTDEEANEKSYEEVFKSGYPMIFERSKTDATSDFKLINSFQL